MTTHNITANQFDILDHTQHNAAGNCFCGDSDDMQVLIRLGLMRLVGKKPFVPDPYFTITRAGVTQLTIERNSKK